MKMGKASIVGFKIQYKGSLILTCPLVAQTVKSLLAMRETWVRFLGQEDPLRSGEDQEKEMAIHSSTLACKIPWMEEPDSLQSMGSQHTTEWLHLTLKGIWRMWIRAALTIKYLVPGSGRSPGEGNGTHDSILAWKIPQTEEPGGLQSMGSSRVRQDLATKPPALNWCY